MILRSLLHICKSCFNKFYILYRKEIIESNEKFAFLKDAVSKVAVLDKSKKDGAPGTGAKRKQKEKEKK